MLPELVTRYILPYMDQVVLQLSSSDFGLGFRNMKSSVYNIFDDISETKFSGFKKAIWMECIQEQNEIIFVPSGWYHQVHNLEDTISINHNWFNAYNLSWVVGAVTADCYLFFQWDLLLRDYKEAKEYIEDIKDICDNFEGLCQRNLAANTGMNFNDFFIFISHFSLANVVELYYIHNESKSESSIRHWSDMVQHFAQNLASMRKIALKMKSEGGVQGNLGILDLRESLSDPKTRMQPVLDISLIFGTSKPDIVTVIQSSVVCILKKSNQTFIFFARFDLSILQCTNTIIIGINLIESSCTTLVAIYLRWRKLKKEIPFISLKAEKVKELSSIESKGAVEEHEVHFGGRSNFEDVFSKFLNETDGSNIGVLVCGPESRKRAVASLCQQKSQWFNIRDQKKKPYLSFHALNFTL
ncbi:JmjC domain - like 4 [Theobroma cacao]|nr:JmjC domain - like 4 [Theobroma cacao]